MAKRLPPGIGLDLDKPVLFQPHQQAFQTARRRRVCLACGRKGNQVPGQIYQCPHCKVSHPTNLTAPHVFNRLHLRAGRRSGKSLNGAHGVREEISVPNQRWWAAGPTFKILHDATIPTLIRIIPPSWVADWNQENLELILTNGSQVQFRSLDDPERARGPGLNGVWLDEAAFISERAWHVLEPTLLENAGVCISTTSPGGFDWTYKEFLKPALIDRKPGYWAARYRTIDNPIFQINPILKHEVEEARRTKPPAVFAAEYEGEDVNFTGSVYDYALLEKQILRDDAAIKKFIPEWPSIDLSRPRLVGLDSGADHPFGATLGIVTDKGIVLVSEYLVRRQAVSQQLEPIRSKFGVRWAPNVTWAANKNEANLRLEFGLQGIGVVPAENKQEVGIQRVQSWLYAGQLFFAYTCPITIEQFKAYRYADNTDAKGAKREKELVFKKDDELPDSVRYMLMAFPELPAPTVAPRSEAEQARLDAFDDRTRLDLERLREYRERQEPKTIEVGESGYPWGDFWGGGQYVDQ